MGGHTDGITVSRFGLLASGTSRLGFSREPRPSEVVRGTAHRCGQMHSMVEVRRAGRDTARSRPARTRGSENTDREPRGMRGLREVRRGVEATHARHLFYYSEWESRRQTQNIIQKMLR